MTNTLNMLDEDGDREGSKDTRHPRGEGSG